MSSSRFSIQTAFLFTAAFACGFSVSRSNDGSVYEFCLGALTVFIAFGLAQQILWPPKSFNRSSLASTARRLCISLVLGCLCIAIFRAHCPYTVPSPNDYGTRQEEVVASSVAMPLWVFTLVLGSLTASGFPSANQSSFLSWRRYHHAFAVVVATVTLVYVAYLAAQWAIITALVDIALQSVKVGMHQGPAVDTPHFVAWFGRSPQQFDEFVTMQIWSWPPLILGLFLAVGVSQTIVKPKRWLAFVFGIVGALAIPATLNGIWLSTGGALQIFPEFVKTYWSEPRPELAMISPPLLLVTLYLTTRRVHLEHHGADAEQQTLCCDRSIVGWLFIVMGVFGFVDVFRDFYLFDSTYDVFDNASWLEVAQSIPHIVSDMLSYPEYAYPIFLLPYGIGWLWRRHRSGHNRGERWPQVGTHQLLCFPLVLLLLLASIILSIPFGVAVYHVQL